MTPQYILEKSLCRLAFCGMSSQAKYRADRLNVPEYIRRFWEATFRADEKVTIREHDVQSARSEIENMGFAKEYVEPGYTDPERGILFANWNYFPNGIDSILERYGFECEWSDEWSTCEDCGRAVRISPNSYMWTPSFTIEDECNIICHECLPIPDEELDDE